MPQNLVNMNITADELASLMGSMENIRAIFGNRAISLSPEERRSITKMGDKSRTFCEQAVAGINAHSGSMPADLDVTGLSQDLADFATLDAFYTDYLTLGEKIDDTLKALSSDVMTGSIIGVTFLKALNKLNPGLDTLLKSLSAVRRSKPAAKPPAA